MPELRKDAVWKASGDASLGQRIDWDAFKYRDAARERKRREELAAAQADPGKAGRERDAKREAQKEKGLKERAWSGKLAHKDDVVGRRERKVAKRTAERRAKMTEAERAEERALLESIAKVRERGVVGGEEEEFGGFDD